MIGSEGGDLERMEGEIGEEKNSAAPVRVNDGNETHEAADRAPEEINAAMGKRNSFFPIDRAGSLGGDPKRHQTGS